MTPTHWRLTFKVTLKRNDRTVEFRHTANGVPGTKTQAARHVRSVLAGMWPSATLRLARALPDRVAEAADRGKGLPTRSVRS